MLLILPLWTGLVACGFVGVPVKGYPVTVDGGCVLRKNSGPDQTIGLAMLTDLFGEKLMTETNKTTYCVSICRRIPLYGSTRLAGAVQYNSKGEYVVLGEIDQAEVFVNEKTIVLTYIGNDVNANLNEKCNGSRWKTYLTFICDPNVIEDTLKLVGEDFDQPGICQIKFEIPTSKICRMNSNDVVRTPVIHDKDNNLPLIMNGSHNIDYTHNNNSSTNNIVSDVNDNNLNNDRHNEFVYIQTNLKRQNLHQGDSNNYFREPNLKGSLMMNTDISTLVKQPSLNASRVIEEINDELTISFVKLILTVIPKPIFVVCMVAWSVYYRCFSSIECKHKQPQHSETPNKPEKGKKPKNKNRGNKGDKNPNKKGPKSGGKNRKFAPRIAKSQTDFKILSVSAPQRTKSLQVSEEGKPDDNNIDTEQHNFNSILSDADNDLGLYDVEVGEQNDQENRENEFTGVNKVGVEVKGQDHYEEKEEENASQVATRKKFWMYIWITIGVLTVAIIMLILHIPLGSLVFCLIWIWCVCKLCKPGQENNEIDDTTPLTPDEDASNENVTHNQCENEEEFAYWDDTEPTAVVVLNQSELDIGLRDKDIDLGLSGVAGEKPEQKGEDEFIGKTEKEITSQVSTGSTSVHVEQSTPAVT